MRPVTLYNADVWGAINEIIRASHESDITELATNFSVANAPSAIRAVIGANVQASTTGVGNGNDATEDTLYTFSLPASSLTFVGQTLEILAAGTLANNAHNKTVKLYFGTQVYSLGTVATANVVWSAKLTVIRTAADAQLIYGEGIINATPIARALLTGAEDDGAAIVIKVTGQTGTAAASDVVAKMLSVSGWSGDITDAFATWIADCRKGGRNRTR